MFSQLLRKPYCSYLLLWAPTYLILLLPFCCSFFYLSLCIYLLDPDNILLKYIFFFPGMEQRVYNVLWQINKALHCKVITFVLLRIPAINSIHKFVPIVQYLYIIYYFVNCLSQRKIFLYLLTHIVLHIVFYYRHCLVFDSCGIFFILREI